MKLRKKTETEITKICDEKGNIKTYTIEIDKIIWRYFENLYSNKIENLKDIDRFLKTYDLPKLNLEDIHN